MTATGSSRPGDSPDEEVRNATEQVLPADGCVSVLPPADRAHVLQRFLSQPRRSDEDGLGLPLVTPIADLHGFAFAFVA